MYWLCPPSNSYVEGLIPNATAFGDGAFAKVTEDKWGPDTIEFVSFIKKSPENYLYTHAGKA